jgi:hypothetical protein
MLLDKRFIDAFIDKLEFGFTASSMRNLALQLIDFPKTY